MYINFWYPICLDSELKDEPIRTKVLGAQLAAFRDGEGNARVISDACVHRGASLGKGWVENGNIICPYHGWAYDGEGACVHIPSLDYSEDKVPARAKVDSYPVQIKYDIVFAFLGDLPEEERPPIWEAEELNDPAWRACPIHVFEIPYYYERSVENGLDPSHNQYVHPNQGAPTPRRDYRKDPIDIVREDWRSHFTLEFKRDQQGLTGDTAAGEKQEDGTEMIIAGTGHMGPNQLVTWIYPTPETRFRQYFFEAPIDENTTRVFFLTTRTTMLDEDFDEDIMEVNLAIAGEDINVVKEIDPIRTPVSPTKEVLLGSDAPAMAYREYLKSWEEKGWKVDIKKYREMLGDYAMVIPSPDRRTKKGWVLDTLPLIPAKD